MAIQYGEDVEVREPREPEERDEEGACYDDDRD
jgi:hypothetical protein